MNTSTQILPSWFIEAEALKAQVLERLEKMSPEERQLFPRPGGWSASQVTAHLIRVEEVLVQDWHPAALSSPAVKLSRRSGLMIGMATAGLNSRSTWFRVPTVPGLEPDAASDFSQLFERWQAVRGRLIGTFPADASQIWIIHPIFGPLSSRQFGTFLAAHLRYHLNRWPVK